MLTNEIKDRVNAKIAECIVTIEKRYNVKFKTPTISYDLTGTTAGTANYVKWHVRLHPVLLVQNLEDYLKRTVPHELAHLACELIYPEAHHPKRGGSSYFSFSNPKREVHGPRWQSIMVSLGVNPSRCHKYDVSDVKRKRSGSRDYKCPCGAILTLSARKHNRLQQLPKSIWHRGCKGLQLVLVSTKEVPVATLIPPTVSKQGTKMDMCRSIYQQHKQYDRAALINLFVTQTGCTPAGAATYYATLKKNG